MKKNFDGKFLITQQVKYETVDKPLGIERFELGALEIQNLIDDGVIEMSSSIGFSEEQLRQKTLPNY